MAQRDALADADAHGAEASRPPASSASCGGRSERAPDMPSGWPRAMAPPFGFTLASSAASPRRSTARPWAAKASFSSITSMSLIVRPRRCQQFLAGRGRADAHDARRHACGCMPRMRARGVRPYASRTGLRRQHHGSRHRRSRRSIAGRHRPPSRNGAAAWRGLPVLCLQRGMLVGIDDDRVALALRDRRRG